MRATPAITLITTALFHPDISCGFQNAFLHSYSQNTAYKCTTTTTTTRFLMDKRPPTPHKRRRNGIVNDSDVLLQEKPEKESSVWSSFKEGIYATADTTVSLVTSRKRKQKDPKFKFQQRVIENGYGDQIETSGTMNTVKRVPDTDMMLRQYEAMQRELRVQENTVEVEVDTTPKVIPVTTSNESTPRSINVFDNFKEILYSTGDTIRSLASKKEDPKPVISTIKPIVKPLNNEGLNLVTQQLIPGLTSSDPIQRFQTKLKIDGLDKDQRERENALIRASTFTSFKNGIYFLVDAFQKLFEQVGSIPTVASNTVQQTQKLAELTVDLTQRTIKDIQGTPLKIQKTQENIQVSLQNAQKSLQNAKEITEIVVQDVQSIPSTVKTSLEDTKTKVNNQIQSTQNTIQEIQKIPQKIKIMTGIEPPPPPPPPPPKTNQEIAVGLSLELAKGIGKGVWFVGKGAVGLGFRGVKAVVVNSLSKNEEDTKTKTRKGRFVSKRTVALEREKTSASLTKEVETILSEADVVLSSLDKEEMSKPPAFFYSVLSDKKKNKSSQIDETGKPKKYISAVDSSLPEAKNQSQANFAVQKTSSPSDSNKKAKPSIFRFFSKQTKQSKLDDGKTSVESTSTPSESDPDIQSALQRARNAAARASAEVDEIEVMLNMKDKK